MAGTGTKFSYYTKPTTYYTKAVLTYTTPKTMSISFTVYPRPVTSINKALNTCLV